MSDTSKPTTVLESDAKQLIDNCRDAPDYAQNALFGVNRRAYNVLMALADGNTDTIGLRGNIIRAVKDYRIAKEYFCNRGQCW
jgi:hypothetical protein